MREEDFFITDEYGQRHYWPEIKRQRALKVRLRPFVKCGFVATVISFAVVVISLIANVDWLAAEAFGASFLSFAVTMGMIVATDIHISQWEREWAYLQEDRKRAALGAPEPKTVRAQQPQGATADEGTI
jgi:hypothetical protein